MMDRGEQGHTVIPRDDAQGVWSNFWQYAAEGQVRLPVCSSCGVVNWYPSYGCRSCGGADFTWHRLSGDVEVFTALSVHRDFEGAGRSLPFRIALVQPVEYPEVRILAHVLIENGDSDPIRVGERARLSVTPGPDRPVISVVPVLATGQ